MNRHRFCAFALLASLNLLAACHPEMDETAAPPVAVHEAPQHAGDVLAPRD
ncbi:MAG: hypothetical protein WDN72_00455 [Alphaproteobacteria bacterium]